MGIKGEDVKAGNGGLAHYAQEPPAQPRAALREPRVPAVFGPKVGSKTKHP